MVRRQARAAGAVALIGSASGGWANGAAGGAALQLDSGVGDNNQDQPCVIVANLHVRKCGGTSVRSLFQAMPDWTEMQAGNSAPPAGRFWIEVHDDEDVASFNSIVDDLKAGEHGPTCKIISTLLMRDAVDQAMSEWFFFYKDQDHSEQGYDPNWAQDMFSYVMSHPENELRWLTMDAENKNNTDALNIWKIENPGVNVHDVGMGAPVWTGLGNGIAADCSRAVDYTMKQFAKIDLVGTMDTPEEFASFWIALGNLAGFEVFTNSSDETVNAHGSSPDGPIRATDDSKFTLTSDQRQRAETVNICTQKVTAMAKARHQAYTQAHVKQAHVEHLMGLWKRGNFSSVVGHEHEEMKKTPKLAVFPPVESWGARRARVEKERAALKAATMKTQKA